MKYNVYKELLDHNNILRHLFLLTCDQTGLAEKIGKENENKTPEEADLREVEIEVFIEGISVNPKKFFDLFVDQYDRMLKEEAQKMLESYLNDKVRNIRDKLCDIEEVVESFSKEINWDSKNIFLKEED